MRLTIEEARGLVERVCEKLGYSRLEAEIISDHLMDCELRGLSFGGLPRLVSVTERLAAAGGRSSRPIEIVEEGPSSAAIDGGDQLGYLVGAFATDVALAKAKDTGIGAVGAKETWYTGMFSYYLEKVTAAGFVGMIAGSGLPLVAPSGGTQARFGTNPIAFGFPTSGDPIIHDIGTAAVMLGEVHLAKRLGEPLAEGLAYDAAGQPTRDAAAALDGGAFSVWGGHKGSGLSMVVQLLGMLCGAAGAPVGLKDCGFFLLVVDPALFGDREDFAVRAGAFADDLRATRALDPHKPVRVPFQRSAADRAHRRAADVIEVPDAIYASLAEQAAA